jgi:hypothetical protein
MVLQGDEAQVEPCFGPFGVVLILTQDNCIVYDEHTIGSAIILEALDELLRDVGHGKSCFGQFRDGLSVGARSVHGLHQTYHRLGNHFG